MPRFFHSKIGGILRLLAIPMAMLAPPVSQTLSADQRLDLTAGAFCSARNGPDFQLPNEVPIQPIRPLPDDGTHKGSATQARFPTDRILKNF
ncbi:hypothetical protein G3A39_34135 [Paraburkholderia aspalathi]|uniref:DUF2946 family protein n=1 Tax=Paraburkholderia nemoris TaxID=2793076 RepID=UPI00190A8501|nr:DUF2946 family protein [Paraburkholderia nemoris]MBK3744261.1 hypothetical protein [Paraburkholderia aspalathi]